MTDNLILKPARAFQVVIFVQYDPDARTDQELTDELMKGGVTVSLDVARSTRNIGIVAVAPVPPPGTPQ